MALVSSDKEFKEVPMFERTQELEDKVAYFVERITPFKKNKIDYTREPTPTFKDSREQAKWEKEEIRRCIHGHQGMCGKMYFFYKYCYILNLGNKKILPEYRVCDNAWFQEIEDCTNSNEWGLICVKRRRVGASWKEAADSIHDASFKPHSHTGMNSKSEKDSIHLYKKVMFIYDNLPQFLRIRIGSRRNMSLEFFIKDKDENGNVIKRGTQSAITVVAPTDSAYEGLMLHKWICDEAGKIKNLAQMWSYTEDCMMQETVRMGIPIIFGTSGEVNKDGKGLVELWTNSEIYKLKRFFFGGWMGLYVDEFGNDNVEEAVRWIIYERKRREGLSNKMYTDFIQRYPLTVDEAFSQAAMDGIGNIVDLNAQISRLRNSKKKEARGIFTWDGDTVKFTPRRDGPVIIYEHPEVGMANMYVAGCDPADTDDTIDPTASNLSLHIIKKQNGLNPPKIVLEYVDRPDKKADYYNQAIMALVYYNETKILIEKNRFRMISYFEDMGYKYLLKTSPQSMTKLIGGRSNVIGVHMNDSVKEYAKGLIEDHLDEYVQFVPSIELLQECIDYGTRNTDRVISFGLALILLKEDKSVSRRREKQSVTTPRFSYKKIGNKIIMVHAK